MIEQIFRENPPRKAFAYNQYKEMIERLISETNPELLDQTERTRFEFTKLNVHRSNRIEKTYFVSKELINILEGINKPQLWMIITEEWCGDSAQNLPYIVKMAERNSLIKLRIILRDENLDIMNQYLTDGKFRSIPKLVAYDEKGNEIFQWGARPKEVQTSIEQWKNEGLEKSEWIEKLHLWYGRNRGKNIESEFIEILSKNKS